MKNDGYNNKRKMNQACAIIKQEAEIKIRKVETLIYIKGYCILSRSRVLLGLFYYYLYFRNIVITHYYYDHNSLSVKF